MQASNGFFCLATTTLLLVSCGLPVDDDNEGDSTPIASPAPTPIATPIITPTPTSTPTPTPVITPVVSPIPDRQANLSCTAPTPSPGAASGLMLERAFPDLPSIDGLISLQQAPNDNRRWFALERAGRVLVFDNDPTASNHSEVLDISAQVSTFFEMGLTGMAIHPAYPGDRRLFLLYNDDNENGRSTLSSFELDPLTLKASGEKVLLTLPQPAGNHNGGDIAFGADGYLYIGFGDGGSTPAESQNLNSLLGSVLRIDIDAGSEPYAIPADNPFAGNEKCESGSGSAACPETYAWGFRNPWRWSFDAVTGDLWLADVGQSTWEEVNRVESGKNYGWDNMEANACYPPGSNCDQTGLSLPITQYDRNQGRSVTGGYVYRGSKIPSLAGQYIFADFATNAFMSVPANSGTGALFSSLDVQGNTFGPVDFAQDQELELYVLNLFGSGTGDAIYKLASSSIPVALMPENLSDTGCFDVISKSSPQGVVNYPVNSRLWSDGATKSRFFAIPDSTSIQVQAEKANDFSFPEGSILVKHFLDGVRYLETRLFVHFQSGWRGYSYKWNDAQTEAVLVDGGETIDTGNFVHTIPTRQQCFQCHTAGVGISLGLEAGQQSGDRLGLGYNFLDYLGKNYLDSPLAPADVEPLYALDDTSTSVGLRARSYLHSNCSGCHRSGAPAAFMDLRYTTLLADTNACNVGPTLGNVGAGSEARRIKPGNADESVLLLRMKESAGAGRMPPVASIIEHPDAIQIISDWINGLVSCD